MYKKIHVIINHASGIEVQILGILNSAFKAAGIEWEALVTKDFGDAGRYTRKALRQRVDAVALYGGDGTVMEVATEMRGSKIPMAILPGGTANVMAKELGIPMDLAQAVGLLVQETHSVRTIDLGQTGNRCFLVRLSLGLLASMEENAEREQKSRLGSLAYILAGLQALRETQEAHYQITVDRQKFETYGVAAFIANTGNIGLQGRSMLQDINVSDGKLDLLVIRQADIGSILSMAASALTGDQPPAALQHWQGKEISVSSDPVQSVTIDGEPFSETPVKARVLTRSVRVIVPAAVSNVASAAAD